MADVAVRCVDPLPSMLKRVGAAIAFCLAVTACAPQSAETSSASTIPTGGGYDFFVLSLSWSPTHCEVEGSNANRQQCGSGRNHGFVVHGLWPQFENGWPEFCDNSEPRRVPDTLVREMIDVMPSAGLIGHQWRKHGSCSGLNQSDYFSVTRMAFEKIAVPANLDRLADQISISPEQVTRDFITANPSLPRDGIAVTCDGRYIAEVRICLTKDLDFRSCESVATRGCKIPRATMPAGG